MVISDDEEYYWIGYVWSDSDLKVYLYKYFKELVLLKESEFLSLY